MGYSFLLKIALLAGCLALFAMTGACSQTQTTIPLATAPELVEQYKIQSADHWDTIANEVANRVQKTLEDRPDLIAKPIYVAPPNDGIFVRTFASLLRSRLVTKGMQVSEYQEPDAITLNYNVQMVSHDSSRGDWGVSIAGLGIAVASSFVGGHTSPSDTEVVINTTMVHRNRYVMSLSQVCYINDPDWDLYLDSSMLKRQGESADAVWQRYSGRGQAFGGSAGPVPVSPNPEQAAQSLHKNPPTYTPSYSSGSGSSSAYAGGGGSVTPIVEEYRMQPGGRRIDPNAPPAQVGRKKR